MSLIVWPQKYVTGMRPVQRECRMSPCVRSWAPDVKSVCGGCHVTHTYNLTLYREELRHGQLTRTVELCLMWLLML